MGVLTLDDLPKLGNYTSFDGHIVLPGAYFVSPGDGSLMRAIRSFTESEVGHAGIHVGGGRIVEGVPLFAVNSAADSQTKAVWNYRETENLSDEQRLAIVNKALELVGTPYDFFAYVGFLEEIFHIRTDDQRDAIFNSKHRVCSALVGDCMWAAGIDVDPHASIVNLVSPKDLLHRIVTY
jgi:uncharacterized protein YycO